MKLLIVSPQKQEEYAIAWIEINTPDGNFVIQPGYTTTTFILTPDKSCIFCLKTGKKESITPTHTSLLNVQGDILTLLLNV